MPHLGIRPTCTAYCRMDRLLFYWQGNDERSRNNFSCLVFTNDRHRHVNNSRHAHQQTMEGSLITRRLAPSISGLVQTSLRGRSGIFVPFLQNRIKAEEVPFPFHAELVPSECQLTSESSDLSKFRKIVLQ